MLYTVFIWKSANAELPDLEVATEADDPLEATFAVMRAFGVRWAYFAWVFRGKNDLISVAKYHEFECPTREVC